LRTSGVADGLTDLLDTTLDRRVTDELGGPHVRAQLVLRHQAVAMLKQIAEDVECLRPERDRQTCAVQRIELCIEKTVGEHVACRCPAIMNHRVRYR
jgi:hypothetical protein